jgi:hypothetical protein
MAQVVTSAICSRLEASWTFHQWLVWIAGGSVFVALLRLIPDPRIDPEVEGFDPMK